MPAVQDFTIRTRLKWNQKVYDEEIRKLKRRTATALGHYTKALKKKLNVPGFGKPSLPGEPPRRQTGRLQASPRTRSREVSKGVIKFTAIATGVPYATALEFGTRRIAPRPAWEVTFIEERGRMMQIIRGK